MTGGLIDIAEARDRVLAAVRPLPAEELPLERALGRVLAADVSAAEDLPPFDSSAMDGFALVAGPAAELPVVGESRAGAPWEGTLEPGTAVRISTGAVIPRGADAVVPVERVEEKGDRVAVPRVERGANVRHAGEDVQRGELLVRAGSALGPPELAALASAGHGSAPCGGRPRVAVLATGDELVPPGEPLGPGQIRDSNALALAALAEAAGATVALRELVPDDRAATRAALERALGAADVVCVSGGVSVGPHDHVKPALRELGVEEVFWGVRLKPGKPTWFGTAEGGRLVFGLPGNPVSAMVAFHLFARAALRALMGADPAEPRASATAEVAIARSPDREQVIRCRLELRDDGFHVRPTKAQGSHVLSSMLGAGAFAFVAPGEGELAAGERVPIELIS